MFRNGIGYDLSGNFSRVFMAPKWFGSGGNNDDDDDNPGKIVEKKFDELETKLTKEITDKTVSKEEFKTVADSIAAMNSRFAKEDDDRRKAQERQQQQQRQTQQEQYDPEKEFEQFAADPRKYIQNAQQPTNNATLVALGRQKRAEILDGKPYYHGDFKKEVDTAIESGTRDAAMLSNPEYINNCYRVIFGKYAEEDKLKDMKRAASLEHMGDGGASGDSTSNKDAKDTVQFRADSQYSEGKAKFAANVLGITDEDVIKAAKEGTVKGLEVLA